MTLTAVDQPLDLQCGVVDQAWIDRINEWRTITFSEILSLQTGIIGNASDIAALDAIITQLIADLPTIICNEISPRFFTGSDLGSNTVSVTLPAGGTWQTIVTYHGADNDSPGSATNVWVAEFDDDKDTFGGSIAETRPGGYTYSVTRAGAGEFGVLSVFAYRENC